MVNALAAVDAAKPTIDRIQADINDSTLKSPRDGRVQFPVVQPGEVLGAGGKVLNIDLGDIYMTFFLPTGSAGRVAIGTEVRLVLDAAPQYVVPARASFVAAAAAVNQNDVLIAGVAGVVAGAMSMAAGEYVSVSSQPDTIFG